MQFLRKMFHVQQTNASLVQHNIQTVKSVKVRPLWNLLKGCKVQQGRRKHSAQRVLKHSATYSARSVTGVQLIYTHEIEAGDVNKSTSSLNYT